MYDIKNDPILNASLYTIRSSEDIEQLPKNNHGKNQIKGKNRDLYRKNGVSIYGDEELYIDNLEISHVLRPLIKIGSGKVTINTLHLHNFGGDGIRVLGSNLTINNLVIHNNKKALAYGKMIIPMKDWQSQKCAEGLNCEPTSYQIAEAFKKLRLPSGSEEHTLHDITQLDWLVLGPKESPTHFYTWGEHIDAGIQSWSPEKYRGSYLFTKSIDEISQRITLKENLNASDSTNLILDFLGKRHTQRIYENGRLIGVEILSKYKEDPANSDKEDFLSTSSDDVGKKSFTDIITEEELFNITNKHLTKESQKIRLLSLTDSDNTKPLISIDKPNKVTGIHVHSINIHSLHPESQIFMLSEETHYDDFQIGTKKLNIEHSYPYWFSATSLTNSIIGNYDKTTINVTGQVKVGLGGSCKASSKYGCIKDSIVETKRVELINVGKNAYQLPDVTEHKSD